MGVWIPPDGGQRPPEELAAQAEALDQLLVATEFRAAEIVQQAAALADHDDQAAAGVVVALVRLEMGGQVLDPLGLEGHLDLHGTAILLVLLIFLLDRRFDCAVHHTV